MRASPPKLPQIMEEEEMGGASAAESAAGGVALCRSSSHESAGGMHPSSGCGSSLHRGLSGAFCSASGGCSDGAPPPTTLADPVPDLPRAFKECVKIGYPLEEVWNTLTGPLTFKEHTRQEWSKYTTTNEIREVIGIRRYL